VEESHHLLNKSIVQVTNMNETEEVGSTMPSLFEASEEVVAAATQEEKKNLIFSPYFVDQEEKKNLAGFSLYIEDQDVEGEEEDDPFAALLAEETISPFKFTKEWDDFGAQASTEDINDKPFRFTTNLEGSAQEVEANENIDTTAVETGEEIIEETTEKKEPDTTTTNLEDEVDESEENRDNRSPRKKKRNETGLVSPVFGSLFHQEEVEVDVPEMSQSPESLPDLTNRESDPLSDEFNLDEEDPGIGPLKIELDDESSSKVGNMIIDDSNSVPDLTDEEEDEAWGSVPKTLSLGGACISESYAPEISIAPQGRREIWSISAQLSQCVSPRDWKSESVRESVSSDDNSPEGMCRYLLSVLQKLDNDTAVMQLKRVEGILAKQLSTEKMLNAEREELQKRHLDLVRRTAEAMSSMKLNLGAWVTLS